MFRKWLALPLGTVAGLAELLLLGVTPAIATLQVDVVPVWPASGAVGDLIPVSVLFVNASSPPNDTESVRFDKILVTPACAQGFAAPCPIGDDDPDVFKVPVATGDPQTPACASVMFTVGVPDPVTGEVGLDPHSTIDLGSVSGNVNLSCQVNITMRVFRVPTNPAAGPAVTTDPLTRVIFFGLATQQLVSAHNSTQITVHKGSVALGSRSKPGTNNVAPGTAVVDLAKVVSPAEGIPLTGSVRFILCHPSEVTKNGCPGGTGRKVGSGKPLVNGAATSDPTIGTNALGKYCWRARYLGDANYRPKNHTDPTAECFTRKP